MLAAIALTMCTVVLFKMKREHYAWMTIVPTAWLVVCTVTGWPAEGVQRRPCDRLPRHAAKFSDAAAAGKLLAPAKSLGEMYRVVFNDYVDATSGRGVHRR